jgi:hypothetical protein
LISKFCYLPVTKEGFAKEHVTHVFRKLTVSALFAIQIDYILARTIYKHIIIVTVT